MKSFNAHMYDVPLPVMTETRAYAAKNESKEGSKGFQYYFVSRADVDSVYAFYRREMVIYGWQAVSQLSHGAAVCVYKKPGRYCVVSVYPSELISKKYIGKNNSFIIISLDEKDVHEPVVPL